MAKLEFIKFESEKDFIKTIKALLNNETITKSYKNDKGEDVKYNVVHNSRLFLGNNFSLSLSEDENKNIYLGVEYFSVQDRIKVAKLKKESEKSDF